MSDFKFADLIKPGEGATFAITKHVEGVVARAPRYPDPGMMYTCPEEMILKFGSKFTGRPLPEQYEQKAMQQCHFNTLEACEEHPGLRYFTGYYCVAGSCEEHSWCVDADGNVVEFTFPTRIEHARGGRILLSAGTVPWQPPEHWAYFGLEFSPAFVRAFFARCDFLPILWQEVGYVGPTRLLVERYSLDGFTLPTQEQIDAVEMQRVDEMDRLADEQQWARDPDDEDYNPEEPEFA